MPQHARVRHFCFVVVFLAAGSVACGSLVSRGPWAGAVTDSSARVIGKLSVPADGAWLEIAENSEFAPVRRVPAAALPPASQPEMAHFAIDGLRPNTRYHYRFRSPAERPAEKDDRSNGTFTTFPVAGQPASFRFAFAACAGTGSTHRVFRMIRQQAPLFYLQTGDLHYENIAWNHRETFRAAFDSVLGSFAQRALYAAVPIAYTWDDHDFGPNGSDRHSPGRPAARATYREYVPHYPLAWDEERKTATRAPAAATADQPGDGPIAQAFTVGRARFIVLDTRSERDHEKLRDGPGKTMLGAWQKEWLKRELLAANGRFPLIFIVSSVSWVSNETRSRDNWGRYATERAELCDWMVEQNIRGVCFLSGDAHMLAADDGRNNNYAKNGGPNFPALQAAPLDRSGSVKGGPWSVTPALPEDGEGQFGLVDVADHGTRIDVLFRGMNHEGREKLRLAFSVPAEAGGE